MTESAPGAPDESTRTAPPEPRSVVALIRDGTISAELAGTAWLLVEARVPLLVAAGDAGNDGSATLLGALLDFVPPETNLVELRGADETFDWLPQASELGWPGTARTVRDGPVGRQIRPDNTILLAELSEQGPASIWGDAARLAVRAATIGYGLAATIRADSLDDVFATLGGEPIRLSPDELSRLGVVLVLRRDAGDRSRVVAAHYVRPVARDVHGHVQRLGPAVLATWDAPNGRFEHFGWGVIPELAMRVGRRAGDFEVEADARREFLEELATAGVTDVEAVRAAIGRRRAGTEVATSEPASEASHESDRRLD